MPRFRAKKDADVPDGIIGPPIVHKGDYITVSDSEAAILRAAFATWEDMDVVVLAETIRLRAAPASKRVAPDNKKVIVSAANAKDIVADDAADECAECAGDD